MTIRVAINIINFISMPATLCAGLLIVGMNPKRKLIGACLYGFSNICLLALFFVTKAESYLLNFVIFGSLTMTNIFQILRQMKKEK